MDSIREIVKENQKFDELRNVHDWKLRVVLRKHPLPFAQQKSHEKLTNPESKNVSQIFWFKHKNVGPLGVMIEKLDECF